MRTITQFIRDIRESPLAVRKRWLVVFTVPTMTLVLFLWVTYMRALAGSGELERTRAATPARVGAVAALAAGWGIVSDRLENGAVEVVQFLRGGAGLSRSIVIEVSPGAVNFTVEGLEEIPKTELP